MEGLVGTVMLQHWFDQVVQSRTSAVTDAHSSATDPCLDERLVVMLPDHLVPFLLLCTCM
jgi:hypothetical protein